MGPFRKILYSSDGFGPAELQYLGARLWRNGIREVLQGFIDAEDPRKPLSDSKIMKILNDEGINIARRTVAKYRDELNIPSSTDRKQIF